MDLRSRLGCHGSCRHLNVLPLTFFTNRRHVVQILSLCERHFHNLLPDNIKYRFVNANSVLNFLIEIN